ncbi:MAG: DUF885 domain-containing protein, partial [Gammaproteobacteria bacterium]|nr:DUF885 domain-containing protein [Gammaproteobacteria bacterium]
MRDLHPRLARVLLALLTAAGLGSCSHESPQQAADARFRAIYEAEWSWRKEQLAAEEDTAAPVADHLPKVDPASQEARRAYWEATLAKVNALARASLSGEAQLNYDIYRAQ